MKRLISIFLRVIPRKYLQLFSHLAARTVSVFYLGNQVECTVCGRHYRKFLPYGRIVTRPNALCPHCLSLERHRLMWLFMQEETNFFKEPIKLLHIAPELCFLKPIKKLPNIDYVTADLESPWATVKMDVHKIPFDENTFDVVICNHLLEHVESDEGALKEIYRVMKPGGWGIIQSPINIRRETTYEDPSITDPKEREKHFGQDDHLREFGLDYPERLAKGGFEVKVSEFIKTLSAETIQRHALLAYDDITEEEYIFVVRKG